MSTAASYLTDAIPLVAVTTIAAALILGARRSARELGLPPERRRRVVGQLSTILALWIGLAVAAGAAGFFASRAHAGVPGVAYGLVLPMVAVLVWLRRSPDARRMLAAVPQSRLVGVQTYRVFGGMFLLLLLEGRIPAPFALPAGWGDLLIGLVAPIVAWRAAAEPDESRPLVALWNVVGLLDLAVALTMGILTSPGRLEQLAFDAPNRAITAFPFVLIPTVLVPVSILLDAASLARLARTARRARATSDDRAHHAAIHP